MPDESDPTVQIITFDFHNTVAQCDPWFDLEIRNLPAAVLAERARAQGGSVDPAQRDLATSHYRALRRQIMETGVEQDALSCVLQVFDQAGIEMSPAMAERIIDDLMRGCLPYLAPVAGAVETVSALIDRGVPVGIVSSAVYHPFLEWALEAFGLLERLAFVATSASIGFYKSDVRIYQHAYGLANATLGLGVHVGDSPRWDIATARQAGLGTVLYADGTAQVRHADIDVEPDLVLDTLVGADVPILRLLRARERDMAKP